MPNILKKLNSFTAMRVKYGSYAVIASGASGPITVDFLVVAAGGGAGTNGYYSGGGGGGGLICSGQTNQGGGGSAQSSQILATGTYPIVVGVGGLSDKDSVYGGYSGSLSSALGFTATGGGGSGSHGTAYPPDVGGSGGGSGARITVGPVAGAAGTPNQGYGGGVGGYVHASAGGGGGGAGGVGQDAYGANYRYGGNGGLGLVWIDGKYYAMGGGGGSGGDFGYLPGAEGATYTAFAGCGRGGRTSLNDAATSAAVAGRGADGCVIIRYTGGSVATGGNITSSGGYTYHTFLLTGTFTVP